MLVELYDVFLLPFHPVLHNWQGRIYLLVGPRPNSSVGHSCVTTAVSGHGAYKRTLASNRK